MFSSLSDKGERSEPLCPSNSEGKMKEGPAEMEDKHGKDRRNDDKIKAQGDGGSALAESPWFRCAVVHHCRGLFVGSTCIYLIVSLCYGSGRKKGCLGTAAIRYLLSTEM